MLGADARLLYGIAASFLMIVGLIVVLALSPATWLVGVIVLFEIAALALVVTGLLEMMSDEQDDESQPQAEPTSRRARPLGASAFASRPAARSTAERWRQRVRRCMLR